jgi:hypothetical protein
VITYLINQVALAVFNLINSRLDAYRILKHKTIAHGINLSAYVLFALILYYFSVKPEFAWSQFPFIDLAIYLFAAFTNRQFSFDIPLNLRRGLEWDYVSQDRPPKAWLDRREVEIFGYNGRAPFVLYGIIWLVCLIVKFFL